MHERMTVMKNTHVLKQQCADSFSSPFASIRVPDNEKIKKKREKKEKKYQQTKQSRIVKAI
jgi:hypothetical protein